MGSLGSTPALPPAPSTPDAADEALQARRQARAYSLFGLTSGFNANFSSKTSMGTQPTGAVASYGAPIQDLLGGSGQIGDDQGTSAPPDLRPPPGKDMNGLPKAPANNPLDPNNPNK